ncbi:hypothetical protein [Streptomyces sp. NPDC002845]
MTTTNPAEELRTAAQRLRSIAADATEGPWHSEDPNTRWGDDHDQRLVGGGKTLAAFNNRRNGPLNADYAAAMHPGVGASLADWLDWAARQADMNATRPPRRRLDLTEALAVARQTNGGDRP